MSFPDVDSKVFEKESWTVFQAAGRHLDVVSVNIDSLLTLWPKSTSVPIISQIVSTISNEQYPFRFDTHHDKARR